MKNWNLPWNVYQLNPFFLVKQVFGNIVRVFEFTYKSMHICLYTLYVSPKFYNFPNLRLGYVPLLAESFLSMVLTALQLFPVTVEFKQAPKKLLNLYFS